MRKTPSADKLLVLARHPGAVCEMENQKYAIRIRLPAGKWLRLSKWCVHPARAWREAARSVQREATT